HPRRVQRLPAFLDRIERRVEHHAMGVQMRIKFPTRIMPETRSDYVPSHPLAVLFSHPHPSFRVRFQFGPRHPHCPVVQLHDSLILIQRDNRDTLWRTDHEVIEDAPIWLVLSFLTPRRIHPLRQPLPRRWIDPAAQVEKRLLFHLAAHPETQGTLSDPLTHDGPILRIVIPDLQMLTEVF